MAEGRQRDAWSRHASLMALLANCHRNAEKRPQPFQPSEFDPFAEPPDPRRLDEDDAEIGILKQVFVDRR